MKKPPFFLTSHDAGDIEDLCKRVIVINHGDIVTDESVKKNLKYNYLTHKIISLKYANEVTLEYDDIKVLKKKKGYGVKVEIDTATTDIDEVIARLMHQGKVLDITIEDPPMEEIIASIYKRKKGGGIDEDN